MAEEYAWNPQTGKYEKQNGREVSYAQIQNMVSSLQRQTTRTLQDQLNMLADRTITFQQWERRARDTITHANVAAAALAVGGWENITSDIERMVNERIRTQMEFFQGFRDVVSDVPRDERDNPRDIHRAGMYGSSVNGTFAQANRDYWSSIGADEEINILGVVLKSHCSECPELSDREWVPIGTLPLVGERECFANC